FRSRMTARRVRWSIAMHGEDHITGSAATGFRGRFFPTYQFLHKLPPGCTFFEGQLVGVGFERMVPSTEPPVLGGDDILFDAPDGNLGTLRQVDGGIKISPILVSSNIRGFASLEVVSGNFWLDANDLISMSGASRLRSVGELTLTRCNKLTDIELSGLELVLGDLSLTENPELRSLAGLKSLRAVGGQLILDKNPKLTQGALDEFLLRVAIDGGVRRL
ncbi:MAG: hypothetical protein MUC96_16805, partial [Myxococcaceae bacterium]|nr:hypothetical protein [Myxococcaceae bacterium]